MKRFLFTSITMLFFIQIILSQSQCDPSEYNSDDLFLTLGPSCDMADETSVSFYKFNRNAILTENMVMHIPAIPETIIYTDPNDDGNTKVYEVSVDISYFNDFTQNVNSVSGNTSLNFDLEEGQNTFQVFVILYRPGEVHYVVKQMDVYYNVNNSSSNDYNKDFGYIAPDETWTISTGNFTPPCSNAYSDEDPNHPLYKYSQSLPGSATAYIKYGDGNTTLTRPFIFVEGIDFDETTVLDPLTGEVIRHGGNGWENVIQGLSESTPVLEVGGGLSNQKFLFRNYPQLIKELRHDQGPLPNYDLVVLDFKDGADYIQKNAKLLIELINRVNKEKTCGYENIVMGLSMGGLVARHALTSMENEEVDHDTRTYVSFDSPHLGANIPLSLQAFVWFNATFSDFGTDNSDIVKSWTGLNKPAAHQMLYETLFKGYKEGRLELNVKDVYPDFLEQDLDDDDFVDVDLSLYIDDLDYSCLRESFISEMDILGFPAQTYNVAIANGSGNGTDNGIGDGDCILEVDVDYTGSFLQTLGNNVANTQFRLNMYGLGGNVNDNLLFFRAPFPNQQKLMQVQLDNNVPSYYPPYDGLPGCTRGDIGNSVIPPLVELQEGGIPSAQIIFDCKEEETTFMPTSSVLAFNSTNYLEDLTNINSFFPEMFVFDKVYLPISNKNEPHVEGNMDNFDFLKIQANENLADQPDVLPKQLSSSIVSSKYNFGLLYKKIPSCEINNNGVMYINQDDNTSYFDVATPFEKEKGIREVFETTIIGFGCEDALATVNINSGGRMIVGDEILNNTSKSGIVKVAESSELNNNAGGTLDIYSGSKIVVNNGGVMRLNSNSITSLRDKGQIIVESGGQLFIGNNATVDITGDAHIIIEKGGELIYEEGADITLKNESIVDTEQGSKIIVKGIMTILGSDVTTKGLGSIVFDYSSISSNSGDIRFTNDGDLSHDLVQVRDGKELIVDNHNLFIDGARVSNHGTITHRNSELFECEDSKMIGGYYMIESVVRGIHENTEFTDEIYLYHTRMAIYSSSRNRYSYGAAVSFQNCGGTVFEGDRFYGNGNVANVFEEAAYVILKDHFLGIFRDCIMTPHELNNLNNSSLPKMMYGVDLSSSNSPAFVGFLNTKINHFQIGINSSDYNTGDNIFLADQTTLKYNEIGIEMTGNANGGLVDINCANLINNTVGIKGEDILLNIDAIIHAASSDGIIRPNKFIYDIGFASAGKRIFDICYIEKDIQDEIPANGNYWKGWIGGNGYNEYYMTNIKKTTSSNCYNGDKISLDVTMQEEDEPEGCIPGGVPPPACGDMTFAANPPTLGQHFGYGKEYSELIPFYNNFCYDGPCNSGNNVHGYYWTGYNCLKEFNIEEAIRSFKQISLAYLEPTVNRPFCIQQSLVANHIANSGSEYQQSNSYILDIENTCDTSETNLYFLLDASGSVSSAEYNQMVSSVIATIKSLNLDNSAYSVMNFSSTTDIVVPLTHNIADTILITRTLYGSTNVSTAVSNLNNYISSQGSSHSNKVILYTDASSNQFNAPPFDAYNSIKSAPNYADVFVVKYQLGTSNDDMANAVAAAVASKGGQWNGAIINNSDDPQGDGGPRKMIAETYSGEIPNLIDEIYSCDSLTITIPNDCTSPSIIWSSTDGGEILSDSVDIESILTNGIGSYSATIICNGCEYEVEYETIDSESAQTASRSQYYRYRSGKIVNPLHFELDEHENIVDITIAPNPASKSIFIDKIINVTQLTILSTSGTEIMTIDIDNKDSINIDIESLQNGVYLIRCNIPNQTSKTLKFVKL